MMNKKALATWVFFPMSMAMNRPATCLLPVLVMTAQLAAQNLTDVRPLYDAGKYRDAIEAISSGAAQGSAQARLLYLKAQSYEKLDESLEAVRTYEDLAATDAPAWKSIAQSAIDLLRKQRKEALGPATRAVSQDPGLAEAHYQLGLALSFNDDFVKAASAFDRAAEIDPQWAYPRYYAGLAYYRAKRVDLMAARFEAFLKLAPNAPERPEVESIMRTLRGR